MAKGDYITEIKDYETWWKQILYWRSHLDVFIVEQLGIKLDPEEMVTARACSEGERIDLAWPRGRGKSFEIAAIGIAIAMLYCHCPIFIVAANAKQSTVILKKIREMVNIYPAILPNIKMTGREPVVINKDGGHVDFLNGSSISAGSATSQIGERAKVLIVDEAARVANMKELVRAVSPLLNYTRQIAFMNHFEDFPSKLIMISSASLKSHDFYDEFCKTLMEMRGGDKTKFACAMDYNSAVNVGLTSQKFFDDERKSLPESTFLQEYGTIFLGEEANTVFPYDLTSACRNMKHVEYVMPKQSKAWYVLSLDIATSTAKGSDNAVICVLKCTDREDGSIFRQLVYIRSYNGRKLEDLADEVRRTYVRFPNIVKVIYDARGLGDSLSSFLNVPWVDPETDHEYPAWCHEDEYVNNADPLLYGFKANLVLNQELITNLRVALEQKTLILPVESRMIDFDDEDRNVPLRKEEYAIYVESDALQVEMGNIVMKASGSNNIIYDTCKASQHKDRYSSLAMGNWWIAKKEEEQKKIAASRMRGAPCVGVVSYF